MWLILLGLLLLVLGLLLLGIVGLIVAGLGNAPSAMSGLQLTVAAVLLPALLFFAGAALSFVRAWRTLTSGA